MMELKSPRPNLYQPFGGRSSHVAFGMIYGFRQYQFPVPVVSRSLADDLAAGWETATISLLDRGQLYVPEIWQ